MSTVSLEDNDDDAYTLGLWVGPAQCPHPQLCCVVYSNPTLYFFSLLFKYYLSIAAWPLYIAVRQLMNTILRKSKPLFHCLVAISTQLTFVDFSFVITDKNNATLTLFRTHPQPKSVSIIIEMIAAVHYCFFY